MAPDKVAFQGLPARICWLGYGDRAKAGLAINELVRTGRVSAPVVIGRDHLDSGSVASPYRETEAMLDGSDAIADWPILNALLNTAAGATWVSVHHGGGVGIGNSIHSGMVVLADGTADAADRLERVLTADPGTGVMRHADAGYPEALEAAREGGLDLPSVGWAAIAAAGAVVEPSVPSARPAERVSRPADPRSRAGRDAGRQRPAARRRRSATCGWSTTPSCSAATGEIEAVGADARSRRPVVGRRRGDRRPRALGHPRPRRLPHPRVLRRRPGQRVLAARGRGLVRGAPRRGRRHPLDGAGDPGGGRGRSSSAITRRHRSWMRAHGTTTFEGKSGYGLDHDTELAQLRAVRAAGGVPTWLGAHTVPPEFDDGDAYLDFLLAEVLPEAAQLAEAADVFLERGSFDVHQARRYLEACRDAGLALRLHGDQFTESGAIGLAIELGARSVDHLEATGPAGVAQLAASDVTGVLLPASALFLGRPMPPARALVDAGALVALATDFNPGSAFCDSLPLVLSLACTQLKLAPEEALVAATVNAAHVLGRADRIGRLDPASQRTSCCSTLPTGVTSPTTSPATSSTPSSKAERSRSGARHNPGHGNSEAAQAAGQGEAARLRPRLHRRGRRRAARRARGRAAQAHRAAAARATVLEELGSRSSPPGAAARPRLLSRRRGARCSSAAPSSRRSSSPR